MSGETTETEAKRARVRRLLIDPLSEDGMRFRKGTPEEKARAKLDRIADDFAYMSDEGLTALARVLSTMGQGSARCFWPEYVTIRALAQRMEPAPFEDDPKLLGWFRSRAGPEALASGRAVAEYLFFKSKWRPPLTDPERRAIVERAERDARRAELAQDRIDRGVDPGPGEEEWLAHHRRLEAHVAGLVEGAPSAAFQSVRGVAA